MSKTALLVLTVQMYPIQEHGPAGYVENLARALATARSNDIPVIFVKVEFRPGFPEISPANRVFSGFARDGVLLAGSPGVAFHPDISPLPDEVVVTKRRTSGFTGSDLEVVLRARGIDTLVFAGLRTSGVVLATLRDACDRDFSLVTLSDGCGDIDQELHNMLMEKIFARYGDVMTIDEWSRGVSI